MSGTRAIVAHEPKASLLSAIGSSYVLVLCGGKSDEREVSLSAGEQVYASLTRQGIACKRCDIDELIPTIEQRRPAAVFNLLYGKIGEGGEIGSLCAALALPCTYSSPASSAISLDKWRTKLIASALGIPTAPGLLVRQGIPLDIARVSSIGPGPWVVKPNAEGSSVGISLAQSIDEVVNKAREIADEFLEALIEPFLPGREFTIGIEKIGGQKARPLPSLELQYPGLLFDMETKYRTDSPHAFLQDSTADSQVLQAQISSLLLHNALGCSGYCRVDFRDDAQGHPQLLELNHFPGMTPASLVPIAAAACGISFDSMVVRLLLDAISIKPSIVPATKVTTLPDFESNGVTIIIGDSGPHRELMAAAGVDIERRLQGFGMEARLMTWTQYLSIGPGTKRTERVIDVMYGAQWDDVECRGVLDVCGAKRNSSALVTYAICRDKLLQRLVFEGLKIRQPRWGLLEEGASHPSRYPVVAKHRFSSGSHEVLLIRDQTDLRELCLKIPSDERQFWLVEEYIPGREILVGCVREKGRAFTTQLPLGEVVLEGSVALNSAELKQNPLHSFRCPTDIDSSLEERIRQQTALVEEGLGFPSLGRMEWRISDDGTPHAIEFDHTPGLGSGSYLVQMLHAARLDVGFLARM